MSHLSRLRSWLRAIRRDRHLNREIGEELQFHVDRYADDLRAQGVPPAEALRRARVELGGLDARREECRQSLGLRLCDEMRTDLRDACRQLWRRPGFSTIVIATIALGIGANTAIFTVVHSVLLQPLRYRQPERLVQVTEVIPASDRPDGRERRSGVIDGSELMVLGTGAATLSHVAMLTGPSIVTVSGHREAVGLQGASVSSGMFATLGVPPLLGRVFGPEDDTTGGPGALILSHSTWQRDFRADPDVIGLTLTLSNRLLPNPSTQSARPSTVVGVMPEGFVYPDEQVQFWTVVPWRPGIRGSMIARLADGASIGGAQAEVGAMLRELRAASPATTYTLTRPQDEWVQSVHGPLVILFLATGVVVLIACVNVTNLLLARVAARRREFAMRLALGANRARVVRHLLAESVLLAIAGGIGGALLAAGGVTWLATLATTMSRMDLGVQLQFPRLHEIHMGPAVFLFVAATSIAVGLIVGLAPALHAAHGGTLNRLREGLADASSRFQRRGTRDVLIAAEVAMATVLLVGAGLLLHSFARLLNVPTGFDPKGVVTFQIALPPDRYRPLDLEKVADDVLIRLQSVPQFQSAAYGQPPLVALTESALLRRTPEPPARPEPGSPELRLVTPDFLDVMGVRVVRGRGFAPTDREGRPPVVLINETAARREFQGADPIGAQVFVGRDERPWEIVGIVADVRMSGPEGAVSPQVFATFDQWRSVFFPLGPYFSVRTAGDTSTAVAQIREVVRGFDSQAGVFNVATMEQILSNRISRPRLYTSLLGVFALVAAVLAVIGLYGVIAFSVVQRTREISVRMALGAHRLDVMGLVLRQSLAVTLAGLAIGLAGAAALSRVLEGLLFEVTPLDPVAFATVAVGFVAVAALASYVPARRATRIDPMFALKGE